MKDNDLLVPTDFQFPVLRLQICVCSTFMNSFFSKCALLDAPVRLITVFKTNLFIEEQATEMSSTFDCAHR